VPPNAAASELAAAIADHFSHLRVDEEFVVNRFLQCLDVELGDCCDTHNISTALREEGRVLSEEREDVLEGAIRNHEMAKAGEQVAAKVTLVDENGSWILASVLSYSPHTVTYKVQDEDDATKIIELPAFRIRRLSDSQYGTDCDLQKGDQVLAIFPETTSFYRAVVSKTPKRNVDGHIVEVVLKFEDDEDDSGRTPHRRVNVRYVLHEREQSESLPSVLDPLCGFGSTRADPRLGPSANTPFTPLAEYAECMPASELVSVELSTRD